VAGSAALPLPGAASVSRAAGGAAAPQKGGCTTSRFGYACAIDVGAGATVHYTLGGPPPPNNCTEAARSGRNEPTGAASADTPQTLHVALESPLPGYAGLGFPKQAGVMVPSDAVIGYLVPGAAGWQVG
jgi:hypothetical protein